MDEDTAPRPDVEPAPEILLEPWKQAVLAALGLTFLACAVVANFPHARVLLPELRLFSRWEMFTRPPGGSILVVVGTPRDAGTADPGAAPPRDAFVMLEDPIDRSRPFFEQLRDQRQRRLHGRLDDLMGLGLGPLRRSYLDHVCRRHADRVSSARLVLRTPNGAFGPPVAERPCEAR